MSERSSNFSRPFSFNPSSDAYSLPPLNPSRQVQRPTAEIVEAPPTLIASTKPPKSKPGNGLTNLRPTDIMELNKLEELANMDLDDLMQPKDEEPKEMPARFLQRDENEDREMAMKMQILVDKLKEYKDRLHDLRDKNLEVAKACYEKSEQIELLKYERDMLEEEIEENKQNEQQLRLAQYALISRKERGVDEEKRKGEIARDLLMGAAAIEGDFVDVLGKQEQERNICERFFMKFISCLSVFVLLKRNLRSIEVQYDKSISAYFSFFKFLVNFSLLLSIAFIYVLLVHIIDSDLGKTCALGLPCWLYFSSISTDLSFEYSVTLMGSIVLITVASLYKWVRADLGKQQADLYGGSETVTKIASIVFNSWDWSTSTLQEATDSRSSLANLIKIALAQRAVMNHERTEDERKSIRAKRTLSFALYILILVAGWTSVSIIVISEPTIIDSFGTSSDYFLLMVTLIPKFLIVLANVIFPRLSLLLTDLENWDQPDFVTKIQLIRLYIAKVSNVVVFAIYNLELATHNTWFTSDPLISSSSVYTCKEDQAGINFFLLVVAEYLFALVYPLISSCIKKCLKKQNQWKSEIKVAEEVIVVVYFQALIWIGIAFFPFIVILAPLLLFLYFKFSYWRLRRLLVKPKVQTQTSFLIIFIIRVLNATMFLTVAYYSYFFLYNQNTTCGCYASDDQAKDAVVDEITKVNGLKELWMYVLDYAQTFWIICVLLLTKLAFSQNHAKVNMRFIKERDEDYNQQIKELQNTINRLQKQNQLNNKAFR